MDIFALFFIIICIVALFVEALLTLPLLKYYLREGNIILIACISTIFICVCAAIVLLVLFIIG